MSRRTSPPRRRGPVRPPGAAAPASLRRLPAVALALGLVLTGVACGPDPDVVPRARLSVPEALAGDPGGYARALEPRPFSFPEDHGAHPGFRSEWWYFTGNLESAEGRRFGYQLTFFRSALAPESPARESAWATRQVYMAHFALADIAAGRFHAHERFSRGALGLAGARPQPFRVWLEDWWAARSASPGDPVSAAGVPAGPVPAVTVSASSGARERRAATATLLPLRLRASEEGVGIDLELHLDRPLVLQGGDGLSAKSGTAGNASYYYSVTRMESRGVVTVEGRRHPVGGSSWLDREWSTSALEQDQVGWDWFALQLDDGRDLMLYLLRRRDGGVDPESSGIVVEPDGTGRMLRRDDFRVEVLGRWRSPRGGLYPAGWRLHVPHLGVALEVEPWIADQELDLTFRYWEGAVRARGTSAGSPVEGHGYVELTGYDVASE